MHQGKFKSELIASKSRVAPLKATLIPRLELCAADLLVNLIESVYSIFDKKQIQTYCWCDSQIVLQWLSKASSSLKVFVANVQTKNLGLADLISRDTSILELNQVLE